MNKEKFWKRRPKIERPALVAALIGGLSLLLAFGFLKTKEFYFNSLEEAVPVFVAKRDLEEGSLLMAIHVEQKNIPRRFLQPAVMTGIETIINRVTRAPILSGEQIVATKLVPLGVKSGLAPRLSLGKRALSLEVDEVSGVAGLIQPNNFVDILATFELEGGVEDSKAVTKTLAQRILVLAVDQNFNLDPPSNLPKRKSGLFNPETAFESRPKKKTLTLALTPAEAQEIEFAKHSARISFLLRPQQEEGLKEYPPVTLQEVVGVSGTIRRSRFRGYNE